ncbi:C-type lectin domain family 4 member F-like isoform X2 [Perca flavescens]|uniref:C-type lectin domain family 4 member F-like isoform X2 n=1 Tax=Perca flavescens TaxID=8167 RepID=UPI00106E2BAB|nr:C-type lectin domain family 4 member F-like isoform X2 [Perca flavescens]
MAEAEVLYSDVKFTREKGNTGTASSPAEVTYSEVRLSKTQPCTGLPGSQQQQPVLNGRSKVPSERVALGVVSVLLAAAVIALGLIAHKNMELSQTLTERDAVARNLTDEPYQKCEEGWELHGGKCYYFSTDRLPWELSRHQCIAQHGDLVKIDSREEQTFLEQKLREKMNDAEDKFWIGLTDSQTEGTWLWVDGSPLDTSLTFWLSGNPDNWEGEDLDGEDCVRMGERGGARELNCWFDKSCKVPHRRICEKQITAAHLKCV